jgi:hypothetical protein
MSFGRERYVILIERVLYFRGWRIAMSLRVFGLLTNFTDVGEP